LTLHTRFPHIAGDLRGAFFSTLVGLPYSITAGMLAFAPFGPAYMANGMVAGIASAAVAGIVNALVGGTPCQINGPRGSVAVLMAGIITAIAVHPALAAGDAPDVPKILGIAMLCMGLSGLLQVAFGLLGFGAVIRFLPYPVISGFMVGLGLLVVWPQIPAFLGATTGIGWEALLQDLNPRWGAIAVGATTIYCFTQSRKMSPKAPAPLIGILAGTALHYLLLQAFGKEVVGFAGFDTLADGPYPPHPWQLPEFTLDGTVLGVVASLLPAIATLAFIGSMESLLSSSVVSIASQMRFDSNRELIAQGVSNVAVAAIGGAVSCGAPFRGVVNYAAGGRTRLSGALHSVMAMPLLFALPVLLFIPVAVLAGVLIVAGWDVASTWYKRLVACPRQDLAVGVLVMAITLIMGTVPAILVGIVGAMFLYVRNTSRAPLRGYYDGALRQSTRIRPEEQAAHLRSLGPAIRIVDVQGALFFGTADPFGREVEQIAEGCRHLILDMRRVDEVDPTGALVLTQTVRRLGERGIRTAIAGVLLEGRRGTVMTRAGLDKIVPPERWFEDADRALEQAEDTELKSRWPEHSGAEVPLSAMDVCSGMSAPQIAALERHLQRMVLPAGSVLFREGDAGDRLYLLARGEITVSLKVQGETVRDHRLGTYCPGAVLGEMAVLERKARSADAVIVSDCVLYSLDGSALESMRLENPGLHSQFMLNLTRQLVERLRARTVEVRAAYS
jgi:sulfate permease, SulP family